MLMNSIQMTEIRKDINFIIDSIKILRPKDPVAATIVAGLGEIDNKLIELEDAHLRRVEAPQPEGPFLLEINEYQRNLMVEVFMTAATHSDIRELLRNKPGDVYSSKVEEFETLTVMLVDLPNLNTVGMIHGLCL